MALFEALDMRYVPTHGPMDRAAVAAYQHASGEVRENSPGETVFNLVL